MATYIQGIHTFIQSLAKKERGVFLEPDQIDESLNRASFDMYKEEYRKYEATQEITDHMRVFKTTVSLTPDVSGLVTIPADYVHLVKIGYQPAVATEEQVGIKIIDDAHWHDRINRKTAVPSLDSPVGNIQTTTLEVRPKTLPNVKLTYLKIPATIKWGYTLTGSRPVYANTGGVNGDSVDPEWPPITHTSLMARACSYLALTISDPELLQYSEAKKQTE